MDVGSTKEEKPARNGLESKSPENKTPESLSPESKSPMSDSPRTERISWSPDKEVRNSPDRETESGSGRSTPRDGHSTPRKVFSNHNLGELATGSLGRKVKKRYFSGEKRRWRSLKTSRLWIHSQRRTSKHSWNMSPLTSLTLPTSKDA